MLNDPVTAAITRLRMDLETARAALTRGQLGMPSSPRTTSFLQATMPLTDDDRSRRRRFA